MKLFIDWPSDDLCRIDIDCYGDEYCVDYGCRHTCSGSKTCQSPNDVCKPIKRYPRPVDVCLPSLVLQKIYINLADAL